MNSELKVYIYSKPNTMDGYLQNGDCHRYTDDVALCYATSVEDATEQFCKLYSKEYVVGNVKEMKMNKYGICICTDY
jgi:hypothetical protein